VTPRVAALALAVGLFLACGGPAPELRVAGSPSEGLVFVRFEGDSSDLYRVRLSDGAVRPFVVTPDREESWPFWTPATSRLVFEAKGRAEPAFDLLLWQADGRGERPLAAERGRNERWASWSDDGEQVVYAFLEGRQAAGLGIADAGAGRPRSLASTGISDYYFRPEFAPDGHRIVAQRRPSDGHGSHLWLLRLDRPPVQLTRDPQLLDEKARFLRDGSAIVYARGRRGEPRDLALVDPETGGIRLLTDTPEVDDHSPRPAPAGGAIAFISDRDGSADVFVMELASGSVHNVSQTPDIDEFAPRWSPDGRLIATTVNAARPGLRRRDQDPDPKRMSVRVLDLDGHVLLDTPGVMPDWMPPWP
jgi:Tol biopolymer transport system component